MNVLLINPPVDNMLLNVPRDIVAFRDVGYPHLGLMYIAAYVEKHSDYEIRILDMQIDNLSYKDLERILQNESPDVIGVPATSFTLVDSLLTCRAAKKVNPNIQTVIGGRHGSLFPRETANLDHVDFVVTNEGEEVFLDLLRQMEGEKKYDSVVGISFKANDNIVFTGHRDWIKNIDLLPFPARHLTPYKKYRYALIDNSIYTTMMTSRGCPWRCLFCDRSQGNVFRFRSPKNVADEIEACSRMGINEFFLKDDTFTVNKKRAIQICDKILHRSLTLELCVRTRVDLLDEEMMDKLAQAGCKRVQFGIESGNQKILNTLRKNITLDQTREAVRIAKSQGMDTLGEFMIGSPGEGRREVMDTLRFAVELDLDYVLFNLTTPYPGTDLYKMGLERGLFQDFWMRFAKDPTNESKLEFWTETFSEEELHSLIKKVYKRYYGRPKYILKRVSKVKSVSEFTEKVQFALKIFGM